MGYAVMILIIASMLTGGMLMFGMQRDTADADAELADYHLKLFARDAAVTGLNLTVRRLAADTGPWTNGANYGFATTAYRNGSFSVAVTPVGNPPGDTVDVSATGNNGPQAQLILARYVREYIDGGIPPAFRNAITTDTYIQLQGNVEIRALHNSFNASIHTNGSLNVVGNSFFVEGYGTYTGESSVRHEQNFQPNIDYNGPDPNVFWADSVHIPPINLANLEASASHLINGAHTIEGPQVIDMTNWNGVAGHGTAENPYILFVDGDLILNRRIELEGYGLIVATGDVIINPLGNDGGVIGEIHDYETKLAIMTPKTIDISGNANITATLFAGESVSFQGTPTLIGGIVSPETHFSGGGTPRIFYGAPSKEIIDPGFEYIIPIGPILHAFSEW